MNSFFFILMIIRKFLLILFAVVVISVTVIDSNSKITKSNREFPLDKLPFCFVFLNGIKFKLYIADRIEIMNEGLSCLDAKNIARNEGMIFVFDKPCRNAFWMKDTSFDLDILFLNEKSIVTEIKHMKAFDIKTRISPHVPAKYAIELKSGVSKALKINQGSKMVFQKKIDR